MGTLLCVSLRRHLFLRLHPVVGCTRLPYITNRVMCMPALAMAPGCRLRGQTVALSGEKKAGRVQYRRDRWRGDRCFAMFAETLKQIIRVGEVLRARLAVHARAQPGDGTIAWTLAVVLRRDVKLHRHAILLGHLEQSVMEKRVGSEMIAGIQPKKNRAQLRLGLVPPAWLPCFPWFPWFSWFPWVP